jgi:DNA-binding CsgD family transcriptional regulator
MTPLLPELTAREEQVLLLLGEGFGLREIARSLGLSVWTVRDHRDNGKRKLCATTTTHAVAIVVRTRNGTPVA